MIEKMKLSTFRELIILAETYMQVYPGIAQMPETRRDEFINLTKVMVAYRRRIAMEGTFPESETDIKNATDMIEGLEKLNHTLSNKK